MGSLAMTPGSRPSMADVDVPGDGLLCGANGRLRPNGEAALHVLFVCTGNICRSPTAERLARLHAARWRVSQFTAASAGIRAVIGHPIHPQSELVLSQLGGDVSHFAARQFTERIGSEADLVLTMTRAHRDQVLEIAPILLRRTFTLTEAATLVSDLGATTIADLASLRTQLHPGLAQDIPDPVGLGPEVFAKVGAEISELVPSVVELARRARVS